MSTSWNWPRCLLADLPIIMDTVNNMPTSIHCSTCQAACCRMQVMIIGDTGMPDRFIETDANGSQSMRRLEDGWCEALNRNTFLCDQYDVRPTICREFEMGGTDCLRTRVDITAPWLGSD